jgi:thioredoxin 1
MSLSASSPVLTVTDGDFAARVLESDVPVLVDFWAAWCPPCRVMHPILDALATERDDVRFASIDVEANPETVTRYGVLSMPTFLLFRDGREVLRLVGARPRGRLVRELEAALS